ncbi:PREDICTED: putative protease Do-like 11, mitochondrial [Camelina sativa]|uniref:Protease Do-like 11, mitochondrial n=1 Tax=Camelina sativa TaxID=90675 RepID=A0ABM1QTP2_CAMSA|nr:PREDICTED: putative protease Do-like 11, mitochondrial [Camelina sativa]
MVFRSCVVTVGRHSARVPSLLSSLFFYPICNNALTNTATASRVSRYNVLYRKRTVAAERGLVLSYAVTGRRKIHTKQEGDKKIERWNKIEESCPIDELILDSVVEVSSTSTVYSKSKPWETLDEKSSKGSGFVIAGKKILTNAHVVRAMNDHTSVNVKKHGSPINYKAKVQKISHECDLAILKIDSDKFWDGMNPLKLGDIPPLGEVVSVVGYLKGGENICVTKGLVLRVETKKYDHSDKDLLSIQIDASIDHGNTGGPVIMGNKVVGVAYAFYSTKNSGFVIPTPIIKHFITGVQESRQYSGFGSLDLSYQSPENVHIRNHYKMSPEMIGRNDEKVPFQNKNRINFSHLVSCEKALVKVLRKGKEHEYNITLKPVKPNVKVQQFYNLPSYYIFGVFVFVPLTKAYFDEYGLSGCKCALYDTYIKAGEHQLVIISQILDDDINKEYQSLEDLQVKNVNRVKIKNLKHLCELVEKCSTKDLRFVLEDDNVMVLNTESARKATLKIMERHKIKSVISKDICLPMLLDDPFKDNMINLLLWSILPMLDLVHKD